MPSISPSSESTYTSLPEELLLCVFANLEARWIIRCRQLSRHVKDLIDNDSRMQYIIELAIAGMEDGSCGTLTTSERLAILREHQEAWTKLAWKSRSVHPLQGAIEGFWVLYDGVFAQCEEKTIHFKQLPSEIRRIQDREWTIDVDDDMDFDDFELSPGYDLLVLIEYESNGPERSFRIHLRSLTTGAVHPANPPRIMRTPAALDDTYDYLVEAVRVCGDYLGLLAAVPRVRVHSCPKLIIWNWRTGNKVLELNEHIMHSFSICWPWYLFVFETYFLDTDTEFQRGARIRVIDLNAVRTEGSTGHLATFLYPPTSESCEVNSIEVWSEPTARPHPASPEVPLLLTSGLDGQLLSIKLAVALEADVSGPVCFRLLSLVPVSTFLSLLASLAPEETGRVFEWADWGPHGSRMFSLLRMPGDPQEWEGPVSGTLFATVQRSEAGQTVVTINDFNPLKVRRALCSADRDSDRREGESSCSPCTEDEQLVTTPNHLNVSLGGHTSLFAHDVQTSLPYLTRKTRPFDAKVDNGGGEYDAVMLSEDSIMMMSTDPNVDTYLLLTF